MPELIPAAAAPATVKDEGSTVVQGAVALNFTGSGVVATDAGNGVANIQISGGAAGAIDWGDIGGTLTNQTDLKNALDAKAPLANPTFTGTPAAPTATAGTNTTQLATTGFVQQELNSRSYIDGEVAAYANLPVTLGTPPVDSAYLVRTASGVWLINRHPAGIYVRTANAGALSDWTYAGTLPDVFSDANFSVFDDGDSSKEIGFQVSGVTAGQKRILSPLDKSYTLEETGHAAKHKSGGADAIKLSELAAPDDNTTLDASAALHGLMSKSDKSKLDGIASGAEVNVNADWNSSSGDSQILNKPTLGTAASKNVGTTTGTVAAGDDSRFTDSRTPTAHATSHKNGGTDEIATSTAAANAIPKADGSGKLDTWVSLTAASSSTLTNKTINDVSNFVDANATHAKFYNDTGVTLLKGQAVYLVGWNVANSCITVGLARANSSSTMPCLGLIEANTAHLAVGEIRTSGTLTNLDTSAFSTAANLYVSSATAGALVATAPSANEQHIATVAYQHATAGVLEIHVQPDAETYTGTGNEVRATSPALVTPNIGTPSAGTLTNCTGYRIPSPLVAHQFYSTL